MAGRVGAVVSILFVCAACAGGDDAASSSTSAPASPSADGAADRVDWVAVVDGLLGAQYLLLTEPDVEGIAEVCLPESNCSETFGSTISFLVASDLRAARVNDPEIVGVDFLGTRGDAPLAEALGVDLKVREVIPDPPGNELIDADGNVVQEVSSDSRFAPGDVVEYVMQIGRTDVGAPWRIVLQTEPE